MIRRVAIGRTPTKPNTAIADFNEISRVFSIPKTYHKTEADNMAFRYGATSLARLAQVHPDLQKVAHLALSYSPHDFTITEGVRTLSRQKQLKAAGASQTLNSRHITGHAIDFAVLVGGKVRWDWPLYGPVANAFKRASKELGIPIVWGGDWRSLRDGPHIELDRRKYP